MTDLQRTRTELARVAEARAGEELELQRLRASAARLDAALSDANRTGDATRISALIAERAALDTALTTATTRTASTRDTANRLRETLIGAADPRRTASQLDDHTPFLLLPLRLETRWVGNELWIRAFPDEIAISSHEPALTEAELARGNAFWADASAADDARIDAAWNRLLAGGAANRAVWIARVTKPANAPLAATTTVDTKAASWTTAPHTEAMPDQLVFTLYAGNAVAHQVVGAPIPSPLAVGPDPTVGITRDANGNLVVDEGMRWVVDFERAVTIGLGVRIPVTETERASGFDRLAALGIRISTDTARNAAAVEALLDAHHYADGLQLLPQGTATNHTEAVTAGRAGESPHDLYARELGAPLFETATDPRERCDGERLAIALGIQNNTLAHVRNADRRDISEAGAINRALWPATLGYFAEQMLSARISPIMREEIRELFTRFVTGRGALPAIRVGRQPYGVLATTAFSRWQPMPGESAAQASIKGALDKMAETWQSLAAGVAHAGAGNDPAKTLLDVLGLQASSVSFDQRRAVGPEYLWNAAVFNGGDPTVRRDAHRAVAEQLVQSLGQDLRGTRALDLELVRTVLALSRPLVDTKPLSEVTGLDPNYIEWLRGNLQAVRNESYGTTIPSALLYVLLRHAVLLGAWDASMQLLIAHGLADESMRVESEIVHVREAKEVTRWDYLDAKIPNVTGNRAVVDFVSSDQSVGLDATTQFREQLAALETLAPLPTARLERLFAEHLDLCTYRLDGWRLGLVARRLDALRKSAPTGIHLGAYGWLEDVRPRTAEPSGGFVHAPSPTHAVTAAIMRAAYTAHTDPAARERMSVDLRSSRVRRALGYVDALQQGHELAALLGFRFERGLHDNHQTLGVEQFLVALRAAFPLVSGRIHETAPGEAVEHIEARNVVDGVRLLEARPQGYPYGASGLPAIGSSEAQAIIDEADAIADDMDALADLVLAETVHQAAQGKHERANAVATGLARGVLPSRFEVVETPRSGLAITHRVCLVLPAVGTTAALWSSSTPRSRFEPAIDRWLGSLLGPPSTIRLLAHHQNGTTELNAEDLGLQPIDLVLAQGSNPRQLAPSLYARIAAIARARASLAADASVELDWAERSSASADVRTLFELAPLLNALYAVIQSRPATAADLAFDDDGPRQDMTELRGRVDAALADLRAAIGGSAAARELWTFTVDGGSLEAIAARAQATLLGLAGAAKPIDGLLATAKMLLGNAFNALPRFTPGNAAELSNSLASSALLSGAPPLAIEQWIAGVALVRPAVAAYENVHLLAQLAAPRVAQLPHNPTARWVGLELADATPRDGRAVSVIVQSDEGFPPTQPMVGVVIDELTEVVPSTQEITGIAFQADRPASEPPQALLLVVPASVGNGWQWSDLEQAVVDTFELAKQRAVEPDAIAKTAYAQVLPAVLAPVGDKHATLVAEIVSVA